MNRTHSHRNLLWSGHWPVVFHKQTGTLLYSLFVSWLFYWQSNGRVEAFTMCILSDAYFITALIIKFIKTNLDLSFIRFIRLELDMNNLPTICFYTKGNLLYIVFCQLYK